MTNKIKLNPEQSLIYEWNHSFEFIYTGKTVRLSENTKKIITDNWNILINKNANLFNGTVISLNKITQCGKKIKLEFAKTDYAHFITSEMGLLPKCLYPRILYVSSLIETTDNFIAFEKTGQLSFDPGRFQFIGGGLDENYITEKSIDYSACMKDEIEEELGIHFNPDIHYLMPIFVSAGKTKEKISIVFLFKPKMTTVELSNQLSKHNKSLIEKGQTPEVDSFVFTNKDKYIDFFNIPENNKTGENLVSSLNAFFTGCTEKDFFSEYKI